ncbi:MAG: SPOR domain-containing protein [Bacteroidales bacterium]|jgi:hypothetical protein|nr:SPOR domain-containing protein [Bacteroidales bacterium]
MRTSKFLMALLATAMLVSSCDFFRSMLGKPTSEDLERMRIEAEMEARARFVRDSIQQAKADSIAFAQAQEALKPKLEGRYFVVVGSFMTQANAERMVELLTKEGYRPQTIHFKNGFDAVAVSAHDTFRAAYYEMDEMYGMDFAPEDIWIYDIQQNLHE